MGVKKLYLLRETAPPDACRIDTARATDAVADGGGNGPHVGRVCRSRRASNMTRATPAELPFLVYDTPVGGVYDKEQTSIVV